MHVPYVVCPWTRSHEGEAAVYSFAETTYQFGGCTRHALDPYSHVLAPEDVTGL